MPGQNLESDFEAVLQQAARLEEALEDRLHEMRTGRFAASDATRTVEVTLDSRYRVVTLCIAEGALRQGVWAAERFVNEALANANENVDANILAASGKIDAVVSQTIGHEGADHDTEG